MYLGVYQLGDLLPLSVLTADADGATALPDAAPEATLFNPDGTVALTLSLPPVDPSAAPGLFGHSFHMDGRLAEGPGRVRYSWAVSGVPRSREGFYEVVAGGHADGAVIAGFAYHRPHGEFIVMETDSSKLKRGRNPAVRG